MSVGDNFSDASFNYTITSVNTLRLFSGISIYITDNISIPPSVTYNGVNYSVTSIGEGAFGYQYTNVTSITIPLGVTSIGPNAFRGCSSVTSITIPDGVTSIDSEAFYDCVQLTSITIPDSVTYFGINVFKNTILTNIYYSGPVTTTYLTTENTGAGAPITVIVGPLSPTEPPQVGDTFSDISFNYIVTSVTPVNSVNEVKIVSPVLGTSISGSFSIPPSVIYNGLTYNVTSIGNGAFLDCSGLTAITIPDSVTSIGNTAFYGCSSLTSLTMPKFITSINTYTFYGSGLTSLIIPNFVTTIGPSAFQYCNSLNSLTIPYSVTSIGSTAFYGSNVLSTIYYNGSLDNSFFINIGLAPENVNIIRPSPAEVGNTFSDRLFNYIITSVTSVNTVKIVDTVLGTSISGSISIPPSVVYILGVTYNVTSIGNGAFQACSGLTSITIPDSVTSIGNSAFAQCLSLTSITIPNSVTSIGTSAFIYCTGLTTITIPNSITSIGNTAFQGCSSLTSITIPDSVTTIGVNSFLGCSSLTTIYYDGLQPDQYFIDLGAPANVNIIRPPYVFYNRSELNTAINLYTSNFNLAISTYRDINTWDVSRITDMSELFINKSTFNYDISNWDVSNVTNMSNMFENATIFNKPLNSWDVSKVTNMSSMFDYAEAFNQPLNDWDVSKVTNMIGMFFYAKAFNQPLASWNVGNVTNMRQMFAGPIGIDFNTVSYSAFNQPLNSWNVSKVTNMSQMFYTSSYNQPLNSWNVSNVTNMNNMFTACLFNQELNNWNVAKVQVMYGMFAGNKVFNKDIRTWKVSPTVWLETMFNEATAFNDAYPLATSTPSYLFFNYTMLYLNQGWNIIGTSYNSNILDDSDLIYNNTIYSMNQGVYTKPITNGQLESTKGYFIKTNNPGYIMSQNLTNFNESYIDVSAGWNLIGVSQSSAILDPSSVIVSNSISTLDSNNNSQIVTDKILYNNKGYFLKSTMDKRLYLQKIIYMSDISNNFNNTISDYQKLIFDISYNIQPNTTLTISSKANFDVNPNITIENNGIIENNGTIQNNGIIVNNDTMLNRGYIYSTGGTTIQNYQIAPSNGAIVNYGTLNFQNNTVDIGSLFNLAGSNFTNYSNNSSIGFITNYNNFTNRGTLNSFSVDNRGPFTNNGGTLNISNRILLYSNGTFTNMNNSTFTVNETVNSGTFNNNDSILNITYMFTNFSGSGVLNNNINGIINRYGSLYTENGGQFNNAGTLNTF